jgi:RNA polymerase sigma factor (sigma-70 family)
LSPIEIIKSLLPNQAFAKAERRGFAELITKHLEFLDELCERIIQRKFKPWLVAEVGGYSVISVPDGTSPENAKEELVGAVMDHLQADDFAVVRSYSGKSSFRAFLTTVVSNLVVDQVRHREGRSRARERALKMGEFGQLVYDLVYEKRMSPAEAQSCLEVNHGICVSLDSILESLDQMSGWKLKKVFPAEEIASFIASSSEHDGAGVGELVVPDGRGTPETLFAEREVSDLAGMVVSDFLDSLSGEEKLLIRMRFPCDEEEKPKPFREIGEILGMSDDKSRREVDRILNEFRKKLISAGISMHDLK